MQNALRIIAMTIACAPGWAQAQEAGSGHEIRGLVRSTARIEYRSDLTAPVAATPVLAGESFAKDDLLVAFDCRKQMAQAAAAAAAEQAAAVEYTSKSKLLKRGAAGKDEARLAAAAHAKAKAEAEAANAVISGCELRAPFAGKMVEVNARPLELPPADRPLLIFLDGSSLELEMVAPSQWLGWLAVGTGFDFVVDETGRTYRGRVLRIGAEVDAISQTVRVVAEVDGTVEGLLAGMSGFARFAPQG